MIARVAVVALLAASPPARDRATVAAAGTEYRAQESAEGVAIGVVREGRFSFFTAGRTQRGGPAVSPDTAFEIGSISKTMTALLLAKAVLAGKARLDDDVRRWLDGPFPKLEFEGEPVRLFHLANMTSALPDNLPDLSALEPDPGRFHHARALADYGRTSFFEDLRGIAPSGRPGVNVAHSNLAAQLLIHALERIYGEDYDTLLRREIERPLGFATGAAATGYDAEARATAVLPRASFGYRYSARDMLRYAARQLDERDPAVAKSHEGTWFTLDRKTWVGLTWIGTRLPDGTRELRYSGGTWGFASVMMLYPERRLGIVLLANKATPTAQARMTAIARRIAGVVS